MEKVPFSTTDGQDYGSGEAEINPLLTLEALLNWGGLGDAFGVLTVVPRLKSRSKKVLLSGGITPSYRTLACHDHGYGYADDKFCRGTMNREAYRFYHWYGLDIFVYFSHYFVTIPPCAWVSAGHLHGVKVLGTLITEHEKGSDILERILTNPETYRRAIDQIVDITDAYGFDGWLINIENSLSKELTDKLLLFVEELTGEIHKLDPSFIVIWYDAITIEGELLWQDELNALNKPFFDVSDGIFLNYGWCQKSLESSAKLAGERQYDVYVGIDVYSRYCSGGGYNTSKALKLIREADLSAAIFAFAWTADVFGKESNVHTSNLLWDSCKQYLLYHGFKGLPFETSFCQGFGREFFEEGMIIQHGNWHDLMRQKPQPLWEEFSDTIVSVITKCAYNGGSTFAFWATTSKTFRLMLCDFRLNMMYELSIVYRMNGKFDKFIVTLGFSNGGTCDLFCISDIETEKISDGYKQYFKSRATKEINEWRKSIFIFRVHEAPELVTSINIKVVGNGVIYLGNLSIIA